MSPVGSIFVPFPPKTGTNMLHPLPPQSLNLSHSDNSSTNGRILLTHVPTLSVTKERTQFYFGKNRTHDFRTSGSAGYLLDHSGDDRHPKMAAAKAEGLQRATRAKVAAVVHGKDYIRHVFAATVLHYDSHSVYVNDQIPDEFQLA